MKPNALKGANQYLRAQSDRMQVIFGGYSDLVSESPHGLNTKFPAQYCNLFTVVMSGTVEPLQKTEFLYLTESREDLPLDRIYQLFSFGEKNKGRSRLTRIPFTKGKMSVWNSFRLRNAFLQIVMKNAGRLFSREVSPQTLARRQLVGKPVPFQSRSVIGERNSRQQNRNNKSSAENNSGFRKYSRNQ